MSQSWQVYANASWWCLHISHISPKNPTQKESCNLLRPRLEPAVSKLANLEGPTRKPRHASALECAPICKLFDTRVLKTQRRAACIFKSPADVFKTRDTWEFGEGPEDYARGAAAIVVFCSSSLCNRSWDVIVCNGRRTIALFCCLEHDASFGIAHVKGCSKHVSSVAAAASIADAPLGGFTHPPN